MDIIVTAIITWVVPTAVISFLAGWYGKPKYLSEGTGICKETGVPAMPGKCPVHGDGGGECGKLPSEIIPSYRRKLAWITTERDLFKGKFNRLHKNRYNQ